MDDAKRQFAGAVAASVVTGAAMGAVLGFVTYVLKDSIRAAETVVGIGWTYRQMAPIFLVFLVAVGLGWCSEWLAERRSGMSGPVLWVPVGVSAALAIGLWATVSAWVIEPLPETFGFACFVSAVGFVSAAAFRMKLES